MAGRPKKYRTEEEAKAAKARQDKERHARCQKNNPVYREKNAAKSRKWRHDNELKKLECEEFHRSYESTLSTHESILSTHESILRTGLNTLLQAKSPGDGHSRDGDVDHCDQGVGDCDGDYCDHCSDREGESSGECAVSKDSFDETPKKSPPKHIVYTAHIDERSFVRGIPKSKVDDVITTGIVSTRKKAAIPGRKVLEKDDIYVVVEPEGDDVVTAVTLMKHGAEDHKKFGELPTNNCDIAMYERGRIHASQAYFSMEKEIEKLKKDLTRAKKDLTSAKKDLTSANSEIERWRKRYWDAEDEVEYLSRKRRHENFYEYEYDNYSARKRPRHNNHY